MHNEQPILVIFADGAVLAPGANTYGELLERFAMAADLARDAERKMRAIPLPQMAEDTNSATV